MKREWRERIVRYTPFILWTGVVLAMSTGGASMSRTSRIIRPILEFLFPTASEADLQFYHGIVRKCAHFSEYAILALLAYRAFISSSNRFLAGRTASASFAAALAVAVIDETYQSFEASRTGSVLDVGIDMMGAAAALLVLLLVRWVRKN